MTPVEVVITIIVAVLGSNGLFALIQYMINRRDKHHEQLKDIKAEIDKLNQRFDELEKSQCRTNLLFLMDRHKEDTGEIMTVAKHYFDDLNGDWYMTPIFKKYLQEQDLPEPVWYNKEDHK